MRYICLLLLMCSTVYALNSLTQFGITWIFDENITTDGAGGTYQYGQFANGDYWIVAKGTPADVNVIMIDPNSVLGDIGATTIATPSTNWTITNSGSVYAVVPCTNTSNLPAVWNKILVTGTNNSTLNGMFFPISAITSNVSFTLLLKSNDDLSIWGNYSSTQNGTFSTASISNGTMVNPKVERYMVYPDHYAIVQGFDTHALGNTPIVGYHPDYNKGRPGRAGISSANPMVVTAGSSIISSISKTGDESHTGFSTTYQRISDMAILTVLAESPAANSFRPGYSGDDKSVKFNVSDIVPSKLKEYALVGNYIPDLAQGEDDDLLQDDTIERMVERPWIDFDRHADGSYMHPQYNMPRDGGYMADQLGKIALILNSSDYTYAQKEKALIGYLQIGIDLYSIHQGTTVDPTTWTGNGQMCAGRKLPILFAGLVLNDADMLDVGDVGEGDSNDSSVVLFGEDQQTFYISAYDVNHYAAEPNVSQEIRTPAIPSYMFYYTVDDIGLPEWGLQHVDTPEKDNKNWDASYRYGNSRFWGAGILAAHMMGLKTYWKHDVLFDWEDRWWVGQGYLVDLDPVEYGTQIFQDTWIDDMWETYRVAMEDEESPVVAIPDLTGLTWAEAGTALTNVSLVIGADVPEYSDTIASGIVLYQWPAIGLEVTEDTTVYVCLSLGPRYAPDLTGLSFVDANSVTTPMKLILAEGTPEYSGTVEEGLVVSQDPDIGTLVVYGDTITVVLSLGHLLSPNLTGLSLTDANTIADANGLLISSGTAEYSNTVETGLVIHQSPIAGAEVDSGDTITVYLSLGPDINGNNSRRFGRRGR